MLASVWMVIALLGAFIWIWAMNRAEVRRDRLNLAAAFMLIGIGIELVALPVRLIVLHGAEDARGMVTLEAVLEVMIAVPFVIAIFLLLRAIGFLDSGPAPAETE